MLRLTLLALLVGSSWAQTTSCNSADTTGPALNNVCPSGYVVVSTGYCCAINKVITSSATCADKTSSNGVNECPGLKAYCNNSLYKDLMTAQCAKTCGFCSGTSPTCTDLTNPSTGRSECAQNAVLCNNSVYREMMKTQCPKTCGYCK